MTWFTGTATGNVYTVGEYYALGSEVYRANENGSFTNVQTGHTRVGSSESAVWWGGGGATGGSQSWSPPVESGAGVLTMSGGTYSANPGTGPASGRVETPASKVSTGPGNSGAVSSGGSVLTDWMQGGAGDRDPWKGGETVGGSKGAMVTTPVTGAGGAPLRLQTTPGFAGGWEVPQAPGWSDVGDFWEQRYGEPGEWVGGIVVGGADLLWGIGNAHQNAVQNNVMPKVRGPDYVDPLSLEGEPDFNWRFRQ